MGNCNKLGFLLFIALISFSYGASAQSQFNVSGSIIDSLKKPIEGVSVKLVTEKDTLKSTTDANGNFILSKVGSNKFYLEVTALGYKAFTSFYEIEKCIFFSCLVYLKSGYIRSIMYMKCWS